jgi:hypothetical protein
VRVKDALSYHLCTERADGVIFKAVNGSKIRRQVLNAVIACLYSQLLQLLGEASCEEKSSA